MDKIYFIELEEKQLIETDGGSPLSDAICYFFGMMFATPGKMATNGAAGHEIMGFK